MLVTTLIMHQPSMHNAQFTASLFHFNLFVKKTAFGYDSISECYISFSYSIAVLHLYEVCIVIKYGTIFICGGDGKDVNCTIGCSFA